MRRGNRAGGRRPGSSAGRAFVSRRGLVANGDPRNIATFSNIPHYFLKAGLQNGLLHAGVILRPEELRTRRLIWNALRPLTLDRPGGWTYSRSYGRTVWPRREVEGEVEEYISHFQLLPPRNAVREPITYYIDATMRQSFEDYGYRIGRRVRADALAREREAYPRLPLRRRHERLVLGGCCFVVRRCAGAGSHDSPGSEPRRGFVGPSEGVGRRAVTAAAGPRRDRLGAKRRAASAGRCLDPETHVDTMSKSWSWVRIRAASPPIRP